METIEIELGNEKATVLVGSYGQAFRIYWKDNEAMYWRDSLVSKWFNMKWKVKGEDEKQVKQFVKKVKQQLAKRW